jgi:hypothetical protein
LPPALGVRERSGRRFGDCTEWPTTCNVVQWGLGELPVDKIDGIALADYLKIFFERSVAIQTFLTIYIAVSVGAITFICTARRAFARSSFRLLLIITFSLFAISNLVEMLQVYAELDILVGQISMALNGGLKGLLPVIQPPSWVTVSIFHAGFSFFVIYLIYVIPVISKATTLDFLDRKLELLHNRVKSLRPERQATVSSGDHRQKF